MSEEEKKAVKELTEIKELVEEDLKYADYNITATLDQIDLESLVIVLNLLEKQQKEIEELKDKYSDEKIRDTLIKRYRKVIEMDYVGKDKIKTFMNEELPDDEMCECCEIYDVNGIELKKKLQELLEKE